MAAEVLCSYRFDLVAAILQMMLTWHPGDIVMITEAAVVVGIVAFVLHYYDKLVVVVEVPIDFAELNVDLFAAAAAATEYFVVKAHHFVVGTLVIVKMMLMILLMISMTVAASVVNMIIFEEVSYHY